MDAAIYHAVSFIVALSNNYWNVSLTRFCFFALDSGLGVDDMYIVMLALRKEKGYNLSNFLSAMKEVVVPVTMTSMVNAGMFAIMNVNVSHICSPISVPCECSNNACIFATSPGCPGCLYDSASSADIRGLSVLDDHLLLSCLVLARYAASDVASP